MSNKLREALHAIISVASGEHQVADDDTGGMQWIDKHARAAVSQESAAPTQDSQEAFEQWCIDKFDHQPIGYAGDVPAYDRLRNPWHMAWLGWQAALAANAQPNEPQHIPEIIPQSAVPVDQVLDELRKELPVTEQECPRHWEAYRQSWGLRKYVVESCIRRIESLAATPKQGPGAQAQPTPPASWDQRALECAMSMPQSAGWTSQQMAQAQFAILEAMRWASPPTSRSGLAPWEVPFISGMVLCPTCGNKRCPHATDQKYACTNSNEVGQVGSSYADAFKFELDAKENSAIEKHFPKPTMFSPIERDMMLHGLRIGNATGEKTPS